MKNIIFEGLNIYGCLFILTCFIPLIFLVMPIGAFYYSLIFKPLSKDKDEMLINNKNLVEYAMEDK